MHPALGAQAPTSLYSKVPTTPAPTRHHDVDCTQDIRVGAVLSDVTGKCVAGPYNTI